MHDHGLKLFFDSAIFAFRFLHWLTQLRNFWLMAKTLISNLLIEKREFSFNCRKFEVQ